MNGPHSYEEEGKDSDNDEGFSIEDDLFSQIGANLQA